MEEQNTPQGFNIEPMLLINEYREELKKSQVEALKLKEENVMLRAGIHQMRAELEKSRITEDNDEKE